jgi:hypothetical protein
VQSPFANSNFNEIEQKNQALREVFRSALATSTAFFISEA